jgi:hypothetical protein
MRPVDQSFPGLAGLSGACLTLHGGGERPAFLGAGPSRT